MIADLEKGEQTMGMKAIIAVGSLSYTGYKPDGTYRVQHTPRK